MKPAIVAALAAALGAVSGPVSAGPADSEIGPNLVVNGGFESGLAGWSASGFQSLGYDYGVDPSFAHGGSNSFQGGAIEAIGLLSQTLPTVAGTSYNIDLWLASDGFFENRFQVLWNGTVVFDRTNLFPQGFTQIVIDPVATGATTTLSFGFRDDSGLLHVDDISARAVAAIPEPSELALVALGLAVLAGRVRRLKARG